jgi:hypothetical protein
MLATPIFDQVRADMPDAPICGICRGIVYIVYDDDICTNCWMLDRDNPSEHAKWHCADCGEFIDGLERHQIVTAGQLECYEDGTDGIYYEVTYLCREHYEARPATQKEAGH